MDRDTLAIAQKTFHKISTMYPALQMRVHNDDPVELSMDIPQQLGLKYKINLNLQNTDISAQVTFGWSGSLVPTPLK